MRLLRDKTPRKDGIVASLDSQLTPPAICGDRPCRDPAPVVIPENSPVGTYGDKSDRGIRAFLSSPRTLIGDPEAKAWIPAYNPRE